jgi:hypothetical protein
MPAVRKSKSRAMGHYDGAGKGRERCVNTVCSRFVLYLVFSITAVLSVAIDLQTVICQVPSVSRAIEAAAKLLEPAEASKTLRWSPFNQA